MSVRQTWHQISASAIDDHRAFWDRDLTCGADRHDSVSANDHSLPLLDTLAIHRDHVDVDESDDRRDILRSGRRRLRKRRRHDGEQEQGHDDRFHWP